MNPYKVCDKIIEYLIKDGYRYQLCEADLFKAIMRVRGCIDERTVRKWINALEVFFQFYFSAIGTGGFSPLFSFLGFKI